MLMDILRMLLKTKRIRVSEKDIDQRVAKNAMVQNRIKYFVEVHYIGALGTISLGRDSRKERVHRVFEHYCERFGLPKKVTNHSVLR
jgi:hypothetical protein